MFEGIKNSIEERNSKRKQEKIALLMQKYNLLCNERLKAHDKGDYKKVDELSKKIDEISATIDEMNSELLDKAQDKLKENIDKTDQEIALYEDERNVFFGQLGIDDASIEDEFAKAVAEEESKSRK